jgi:hypothetical protein
MKIKSAKSFRYWYKTKIKEIDKDDYTHNENFVGTYHKENGKKTIKGFFEMYHGDKPDIASYLPSILKIAEDGQAIYEFLQNAVDCGSSHFYIFYNERYFLAINNGSPFDIEGLQSILNIAQTTKKDPDKIGRFGIGFKLAHRLVGKNEGTDELVRQYKGPILFSWAKLEDLESLMRNEQIEPLVPNKANYQEFINSPYLLKLLLTNFPSDPNETVKDISYKDKILFPQSELNELIEYLNENFEIHSESLKKNVLKQGSLFFIKLGEEKKKLLDKDYSELVNGIQYSMNTLKNLQKVYINNDDIGKIPLQLEVGSIKKGSEEFEKISPEYKEFDIKFAIGFNTINFGNDKSLEKIKLLKEKPNFYKYFPMGDEINGFGFIIHCDSFSNEANRRKLHEDEINRNLFPVFVNHIKQRLADYKTKDRNKFLNLYASLLLSEIPDRQNNKWLRPIFYDTLLNSLQNNVPTKNGFSENAQNVKINKLKISLNLSDFGLSNIQWFEWNDKSDKLLIDEATKPDKLGIEEWDIRDIVEKSNLEDINSWISNIDDNTYKAFLKELDESNLRIDTRIKLCNVKLFKFSDGQKYSLYEITGDIINRFDGNSGNYKFFKSGNKKEDYIFHTQKTINIDYELKKLNFIICDLEISKYLKRFFNDNWNVYYFNDIQPEKNIYHWIAAKCKSNNLSPEEKKRLFLNFINEDNRFDNITENILKNLELFCDSNLNIKPLKELIGNIRTPSFLNTYKIKHDEYFSELKPYIISESEDMFKVIYQQHQDEIINLLRSAEEIKSLIKFYQENKRFFFNEFIIIKEDDFFVIDNKTNETFQVQSADKDARKFLDEYCSGNLFVLPNLFLEFKDEEGIKKAEDLHSLILEFVDANQHKHILVDILHYNAKHKFLQKLTEFRFNLETKYIKADYEYKILDLACELLKENDYFKFKDKVVIEAENRDLKLSGIRPIKDIIKIDEYEISLVKILPGNYENSDHLNNLINQFIGLGLNKERIGNLFGISEEPEPSEIFQMFSEQVEYLENAEQLAFVLLYNKFIEKIDLKMFKVSTKGGGENDLTYSFYINQFNFVVEDASLDDKYNGIKNLLRELPFEISEVNQILDEPCFIEQKFVCPDLINENLTDEQKLSFLDFLFNLWEDKSKKNAIQKIDWSKIDDIKTVNILGFDPTTSVYPSKYACKSEVLPDYLIKWLNSEEAKIDFLSDLGVWVETSVIVELRKYLGDRIKVFNNNRLAQEIRFKENELNLFNSFVWLKEMEISLKTAEHFEKFKKVVEVINENRANYGVLEYNIDFDFEELKEKATEWEESYYENWKKDSGVVIFLYNGEVPITISLNEIDVYVFYNYYEGNIAIDEESNIYINQNADVKKELQKLELEDEDFDFSGLWQNKLEVLELENIKLKKTNEETKNIGKLDEEFENPFKDLTPVDEKFIRSIIKGEFELNEKLDAHKTAKIKTLLAIKSLYDISEITDEGRFLKAGKDEILVRSAQGGILYLDVYNWGRLSEENVSLSVYTNDKIEIFSSQKQLFDFTQPQNKFGIVRMPTNYTMEDYNSLDKIANKGEWHYIFIVNENTKAAQGYKEIMNLEDYNF